MQRLRSYQRTYYSTSLAKYGMRDYLDLLEASTQPSKLETTPLPYAPKDLEPVMSKETIEYHYEHLAKGYAQRYNRGEGNAEFNRAGSFLHNKFFPQLRAPKSANRPKGAANELIELKFKTFDDFKEQFKEQALTIQGSGWLYLSTQGDIKIIRNHSVRTDIALLLDMWEHAYALQYQWDKAAYIDSFWKIVNWDVVNQRL
jgi:Fe-Mn family superoxide dismutase